MTGSILDLARPDILQLQPYQHAAWDPSLERMHANEMPWRAQGDNTQAGLNRYPEPQPKALVERMAQLYGVSPRQVLVGRGSDEAIDLLVRAFCRAGQDSVVITPPTFGFYKVAAQIQGAGVVEVPLLRDGFQLDTEAVIAAGRSARRSSSSVRRTIRPATCSTRPPCCVSAASSTARHWSCSTRPTSSSRAGRVSRRVSPNSRTS